jgi:hypothetical protein
LQQKVLFLSKKKFLTKAYYNPFYLSPLPCVKQFFAILLLISLLYNAFGYYLLYLYGSGKVRIESTAQLPESALEVAKFKVALYTSVPDTEFENVDVEMDIEGKTYHIVRQRIKNDSLYLYYVRNFQKEELRAAVNDITENQNSAQGASHNTPAKDLVKSFLKDYFINDGFVPGALALSDVFRPSIPAVAPADAPRSAYLLVFSPPPDAV